MSKPWRKVWNVASLETDRSPWNKLFSFIFQTSMPILMAADFSDSSNLCAQKHIIARRCLQSTVLCFHIFENVLKSPLLYSHLFKSCAANPLETLPQSSFLDPASWSHTDARQFALSCTPQGNGNKIECQWLHGLIFRT